MFPAARVGDNHLCDAVEPGPVPHVGGAILPLCAPLCLTGGQNQARLSDLALCVGLFDVIAMGAVTVLVHGLPASRIGDSTAHGGVIVGGFEMVEIGGPTFELPPNMKVSGNYLFQQQTYRDLFFLSTTPSGAEILRQIGISGKPVTFVPYAGRNGVTNPLDEADAGNGVGSGSTIQYNPNFRSNAFDKDGNMIAHPPQMVLGHELCHAMNMANGEEETGPDPNAPKSQKDLEREEAQTIGTGSYEGKSPSENSLRKDLNLPRRDNHVGTGGPTFDEPEPLKLRPGEPTL
jgi:uncharacterized Zn-binding protein involved in type VI secretion